MEIKTNSLKYPIPEEELHKKRLGKHTLERIIVSGDDWTQRRSGSVYHYTSPEGLRGIISSRSVYFTDCQFLNDYMERTNINDSLHWFWECNSSQYDADFVNLLKDIRVEGYEDSETAYMLSDRPYDGVKSATRYFVFSTSNNRDDLNMWKYYAKDNSYNGYSIGLLTYVLSDEWVELMDEYPEQIEIMGGLVAYNDSDKREIILDAVNRLYRVWCEYKRSKQLDQKIYNDFKSWTAVASLFFKDHAFYGEEEYRYIAAVSVDALNNLTYTEPTGKSVKMYDFRVVNGVFVPFIRMPFYFYNGPECWAINSITIAPSLNAEQKKLGLERFLNSVNYELVKLQINTSSIPLRY